MLNNSALFIFYRIKNKKKFLRLFFSIKNSLEILIDTTEKYKQLKKERINLMKKINENNKELLNYLNKLQKLLPFLESLDNLKKEIKMEKEEKKNLFNKFEKQEEIDLDLIKEELKKIEEDLLKLNLE